MSRSPPEDLSKLTIPPVASLREAARSIDCNRKGIALVVDEAGALLGTITDGDLRRAMLDGLDFAAPVSSLLERFAQQRPNPRPVTAAEGASRQELLALMRQHSVRQIPLLDSAGRVAGLAALDDLLPAGPPSVEAVIMAGGQGARLRPLTRETPKPMLLVGDRPLLEHTLAGLREAGIQRVSITTHFQEEKIRSHFGDGEAFGIELEYVREDAPRGTAGSLNLVPDSEAPLLVMNGDILTRVDYRAMLSFHREHQAAITIAVREYDMQVPYGVVESDGAQVLGINEKPIHQFFVNAGIYLLEPQVRALLPAQDRFDMTDLIEVVIAAGERVVSFPVREYWLDIGEHSSYRQAQEDVAQGGRFHT